MRNSKLLNVFLYGLCGMLWGSRGIAENDIYHILLAAVWFLVAGIWFVRYRKEKNQNEET